MINFVLTANLILNWTWGHLPHLVFDTVPKKDNSSGLVLCQRLSPLLLHSDLDFQSKANKLLSQRLFESHTQTSVGKQQATILTLVIVRYGRFLSSAHPTPCIELGNRLLLSWQIFGKRNVSEGASNTAFPHGKCSNHEANYTNNISCLTSHVSDLTSHASRLLAAWEPSRFLKAHRPSNVRIWKYEAKIDKLWDWVRWLVHRR